MGLVDILADAVAKDYVEVYRNIHEVGQRLNTPSFALKGAKPFTMLNLGISNALGVPKKERIACASVVDPAARAVGIADDIIDGELEVSPSSVFAYADCFTIALDLVYKHGHEGIITFKEVDQVLKILITQKTVMLEGIKWQEQNGSINNHSVTFPTFLENYVDKISGGLFQWAVDPIGVYYPDVQKKVSMASKAVKNFSRVFQMRDDMYDVFQDYKEGQLTTALFFVRRYPEELSKLASNKTSRRVSDEEFATLFPSAYDDLSHKIKTEEAKMAQTLRKASLPMSYNNLFRVNEIYRQVRKQIDLRLEESFGEKKVG